MRISLPQNGFRMQLVCFVIFEHQGTRHIGMLGAQN